MERFYNDASEAGLGTEIIEQLKEIIGQPNELLLVTAGDVRTEFEHVSLSQRKTLWECIEKHQKILSAQTKTLHRNGAGSINQGGQGNVNMGGGNIGGQAQVGNQNTYNAPQESSHVTASAGHATGSNIAGRDISTTNYNAPKDSGNVNVRVGHATGSNIAGGDITSTTYNTTEENSKYRINMNGASGVALGDHSSVQGNYFNP